VCTEIDMSRPERNQRPGARTRDRPADRDIRLDAAGRYRAIDKTRANDRGGAGPRYGAATQDGKLCTMIVDHLVERSAELKVELLEFAHRPQFDRELGREFGRRFPDGVVADDGLHNFFDWFVQEYRRPNGRTIVDEFVESRTDLPEEEREFLLGWRDVVEGLFEVVGRDGPVLVTVNLVDDLEYRMRSNAGPEILNRFPTGGFIGTRAVPIGTEWLISGSSFTFGADEREAVLDIAAQTAMQHPELVFRNPQLLERGWELQCAERARFIEHFGADIVVLDVAEAPRRLREYGERWPNTTAAQLEALLPTPPPDAETVGLIYDESDGLSVLYDFGRLEEAFADPELVRTRPYRRLLKTYLTDPDLSPVALLRLADRHQDKADRVFRLATGKPRFSWTNDGQALLRQHKPGWYARPPLPQVMVVNDRLAPRLAAR
jgi:hypothetical protein